MLKSLLFAAVFVLLMGSSLVNSKTPSLTGFQRPLKVFNTKVAAVTRPLTKSRSQGGQGGSPFDDIANFSSIVGVHSINISSGDQINSIEITYILSNKTLLKTPRRGKISHPPVNISFFPDEEIVKIEGKTNGMLVDQLTITTLGPSYEHKVYGPFGKTGTLSFSFEGQIIAFFGHYGDLMDNIGVYSLESMKKSDSFGGDSGDEFDDYTDLKYPPIVRIRSINIWSDKIIAAFQVEYLLLDGSALLGEKHGVETTHRLTTITFPEGEVITGLQGKIYTTTTIIGQLTILTVKENGENGVYGPFGELGSDSFNIQGKILGFFGRSKNSIDRLGAYYI